MVSRNFSTCTELSYICGALNVEANYVRSNYFRTEPQKCEHVRREKKKNSKNYFLRGNDLFFHARTQNIHAFEILIGTAARSFLSHKD